MYNIFQHKTLKLLKTIQIAQLTTILCNRFKKLWITVSHAWSTNPWCSNATTIIVTGYFSFFDHEISKVFLKFKFKFQNLSGFSLEGMLSSVHPSSSSPLSPRSTIRSIYAQNIVLHFSFISITGFHSTQFLSLHFPYDSDQI